MDLELDQESRTKMEEAMVNYWVRDLVNNPERLHNFLFEVLWDRVSSYDDVEVYETYVLLKASGDICTPK